MSDLTSPHNTEHRAVSLRLSSFSLLLHCVINIADRQTDYGKRCGTVQTNLLEAGDSRTLPARSAPVHCADKWPYRATRDRNISQCQQPLILLETSTDRPR